MEGFVGASGFGLVGFVVGGFGFVGFVGFVISGVFGLLVGFLGGLTFTVGGGLVILPLPLGISIT
jgi:hypothetical protein